MTLRVLVLGASGRFGRHATQALSARGHDCRPFDRARDDLAREARSVDVVVNAWNPPYPRWHTDIPANTRKVIEALRGSGVRLVVPGNVYVFGPQCPTPWGADSPHLATNPMGRLRIDMERAFRESGIRTLILRAGDFIDTEGAGNWFDSVITKPVGKGRLAYPGDPGVEHAWAYLPDVGRALAGLLERDDELGAFADVPFPGYTLTGHELAAAVGQAIGREVVARPMPWWPIRLAAPFWPLGRRLLEMRYLWSLPHGLDGSVMARRLPGFEETPLVEALRRAAPLDRLG